MHHSYVGHNIDRSKVHAQASSRLRDNKHPEETVVHEHSHRIQCHFSEEEQPTYRTCESGCHTYYSFGSGR